MNEKKKLDLPSKNHFQRKKEKDTFRQFTKIKVFFFNKKCIFRLIIVINEFFLIMYFFFNKSIE